MGDDTGFLAWLRKKKIFYVIKKFCPLPRNLWIGATVNKRACEDDRIRQVARVSTAYAR